MKLYSKISSERATKGQGGNKYINVRLTVGEEDETQTILEACVEREETETEDIYRLWNGDIQVDKIVIPKKIKGREVECGCEEDVFVCRKHYKKGKKQKGECNHQYNYIGNTDTINHTCVKCKETY